MSTAVPTRPRPIIGWGLHDGLVVARRNLIQTIRVPELLFFSIVQPVIFVLLFFIAADLLLGLGFRSGR